MTRPIWDGLCRHVFGVLSAVAVGACSSSTPSVDRPPAPVAPPVVQVELREYEYTPSRQELPAGRVVFRTVNRGSEVHRPALVELPEDLPPLDQQLSGEDRRVVNPVADTPGTFPGVTNAFAVDLAAGRRYALVCYAQTADGKDHKGLGMGWEFRAGRGPAPAVVSGGP